MVGIASIIWGWFMQAMYDDFGDGINGINGINGVYHMTVWNGILFSKFSKRYWNAGLFFFKKYTQILQWYIYSYMDIHGLICLYGCICIHGQTIKPRMRHGFPRGSWLYISWSTPGICKSRYSSRIIIATHPQCLYIYTHNHMHMYPSMLPYVLQQAVTLGARPLFFGRNWWKTPRNSSWRRWKRPSPTGDAGAIWISFCRFSQDLQRTPKCATVKWYGVSGG